MSVEPTAARPVSSRRTYLAIAAVAAAFAVIMFIREPVQARYYAWQITREHARPEAYEHYFFKLACLKDAAIPAIRTLLDDEDAQHRRFGARLLHHVSADAARPLLLNAMNDEDMDVRRTAGIGLALDADPAVINALEAMVRGDEPDSAALAAGMLGRMGGDAAADVLIDVLRGDPPVMLKAEAIDGLGQIRDVRATLLITAALGDTRPLPHPTEWDRLASAALDAVKPQLVAEMAGSQPAALQIDAPMTVADVAKRALRRIGSADPSAPLDAPVPATSESRPD